MLRGILLGIIILLCLSACAGEATNTPTASSSPSPDASATETATLRPTVDYAQLTEYATYRPTLPATFTPTFTPSITPIPSSTPFPPTRTPLSELDICPQFLVTIYAPQGVNVGVVFTIPQGMTLAIDILNGATMEVIDQAVIPNDDEVTLVFDPAYMPAGEYIWQASLQDLTRTGLCPVEGRYTIESLGTASPEATLASTEQSVGTNATALVTATPRTREGRVTEEAGN